MTPPKKLQAFGCAEGADHIGGVAMLAVYGVIHLAHFVLRNFSRERVERRADFGMRSSVARRTSGTASYGGK